MLECYLHLLNLYSGNNAVLLHVTSWLCIEGHYIRSLKSAVVAVFTLWILENTTNEDVISCLIII